MALKGGPAPGEVIECLVFSSAEALNVAAAIQENLHTFAETTLWSQGIFEPSTYVVDELLKRLRESDCGVFVFSPDDKTVKRGKVHHAVRDNVIFELGLCMGALGRRRTFIVAPRDLRIDFPTDLSGLTTLRYSGARPDGNHQADLAPACNQIRRALARLGPVNARQAWAKLHSVIDSIPDLLQPRQPGSKSGRTRGRKRQ